MPRSQGETSLAGHELADDAMIDDADEVAVAARRNDDPRMDEEAEEAARQPVPRLLPRGTEGAEAAAGATSRGRALVRSTAARGSPDVVDEAEEGPPGTIHPSHHLMQIEAYTFCAVCGVYGKQLRGSAEGEIGPPQHLRSRGSGGAARLPTGWLLGHRSAPPGEP